MRKIRKETKEYYYKNNNKVKMTIAVFDQDAWNKAIALDVAKIFDKSRTGDKRSLHVSRVMKVLKMS